MRHAPPEVTERNVANMALVGGRPVVDFVNTLSDRALAQPLERLATYGDLLHWCVREEIFGSAERTRLERLAASHPRKAADALSRARGLRELLFRMFSATTDGHVPASEALDEFTALLAEAAKHRRLEPADGGLRWHWSRGDDELDWMLWPLAWSASELLGSEDLGRLKECAQDDCRWIFLDLSKNRSRRWCTMEECGNRAKARRHYEKSRKS